MELTKIRAAAAIVLFLLLETLALAGGYRVIEGRELKRMMAGEKRLVIVDVREPELYSQGHIPGAINIPFDNARKRVLKELSPKDTIVFVCHGGPMGDVLADLLSKNGYPRVYNLSGGMRWWKGPLEK